jgi:hypothetical protein
MPNLVYKNAIWARWFFTVHLLMAAREALVPKQARPTFSVEKWHFSVTLRQGARSRALQLRL